MSFFGKLASGSWKVSKIAVSGSARVVRNVPMPRRDDGKPDRRYSLTYGMTKGQRDSRRR